MKIQLIRHATLWLEYGGLTFLIDPMLSEQGANPPITNSANNRRNPLVHLPGLVDQWLKPDVLLLTHLHADHWDAAAISMLSRDLPILCQVGDQAQIAAQGFEHITEINHKHKLSNITLTRTKGQHGTGEIGKRMGQVSGFIVQAEGEPTLYLTGDTIWCDEVKQALDDNHPELTIINAGGARFLTGGPITMDEQDVVELCSYAPYTSVIAVHMDAINHCLVTRENLQERLEQEALLNRVTLLQDGEWY